MLLMQYYAAGIPVVYRLHSLAFAMGHIRTLCIYFVSIAGRVAHAAALKAPVPGTAYHADTQGWHTHKNKCLYVSIHTDSFISQ